MLSIVASIGKNRELGKNGDLCFRLKNDLRFFKQITMNHKIIMGRKTWESLPGKLPGRENIVISRHDFDGPDQIVHSLAEVARNYSESSEEVFVIGGAMIYTELLPFAKTIYLTEIEAKDNEATSFFPDFKKARYTRAAIKEGVESGIKYTISKYSLKTPSQKPTL